MLIHRIFILIKLLLSSTLTSSDQCKLQNGCKLKQFIDLYLFQTRYFLCNQIDTRFEMGFKQRQIDQCMLPKAMLQLIKIHMKSSSRIILDESFDLEGLYQVFAETYAELNFMFSIELIFNELKGFDVISFNRDIKPIRQKLPTKLEMKIYDSSFEFYYKNQRIKSCEDYLNAIERSEIKGENIFQACSFPCWFRLKRVDFSTPICPLAFNNSIIKSMTINELMNTFYRTNTIRFLESNLSIACFIGEVLFVDVNKINLDKSLLYQDVFKNISYFTAYGILENVQVDLFLPENFPLLKCIDLGLQFFMPLIHSQGINWIQSLNKGLNYNLTSKNLTLAYISIKMIQLRLIKSSSVSKLRIFEASNRNEYFPDEDFCLYLHFPLNQLVFIAFDFSLKPLENFTCTLTWLLQYHEKVAPSQYNIKNIRDTFEKCKFTEFIIKCNKTNFKIEKTNDKIFSIIDAMIILEFISIILLPIICLFGLIGNILVIVVINRQNLKENQYIYMKLKALFNCFILFIKMPSMMNECQPNGIFCSDVRKLIGIQYIKIIFSEFFSSYFRFVSNMLHIAFLFNRLSLVGNNHTKFTEFMSKLRPRSYLTFSLIIGLFLSFAKGFRLRSNFNDFEMDYPFNYLDNYNNNNKLFDGKGFQRAIAILNCICDLINGIIFFLVCLVIDVQLLIALRRTIDDKLAKLELIKSSTESKTASLKSAVFRANIMVILNSISNLLLKTPITILAVFELVRYLYRFSTYLLSDDHFNVLLKAIPSAISFIKLELLNIKSAFEHFAECLFLISIGFDIIFYYNFDIMFKEAFSIVILS